MYSTYTSKKRSKLKYTKCSFAILHPSIHPSQNQKSNRLSLRENVSPPMVKKYSCEFFMRISSIKEFSQKINTSEISNSTIMSFLAFCTRQIEQAVVAIEFRGEHGTAVFPIGQRGQQPDGLLVPSTSTR